jgi:endonuclease YncB( thermonuclease family)
VISIADGDTLTVVEGNTRRKIRLEGNDAPEGHQAHGGKSRQALAAKVFQKRVRIEPREFDKYKRVLGHVFVDDRWINADMIEEGWAWHHREYSDSAVLADTESNVRTAKVGLWADTNPTPHRGRLPVSFGAGFIGLRRP